MTTGQDDTEDQEASNGANGEQDEDGGGAKGGPCRLKRPRTILTSQQRRAFKASFDVSSKPCRKVSAGGSVTSHSAAECRPVASECGCAVASR